MRWIIALVIAYSKDNIWLRGLPEIISVNARLALRVYFHCVWDCLETQIRISYAPVIVDYVDHFRWSENLLSLLSLVWLTLAFPSAEYKIFENLPKVIYNLLRFFCNIRTLSTCYENKNIPQILFLKYFLHFPRVVKISLYPYLIL